MSDRLNELHRLGGSALVEPTGWCKPRDAGPPGPAFVCPAAAPIRLTRTVGRQPTSEANTMGKTLAVNRKARHDYAIEDTLEAGLALTGTEIKSIRAGHVNLQDAYARIERGEAWLVGAHVAPWAGGNRYNHEPRRDRKLLLAPRPDRPARRVEPRPRASRSCRSRSTSTTAARAKVQLGLARGKQLHDRRRDIAERDARRDMERETGRRPARALSARAAAVARRRRSVQNRRSSAIHRSSWGCVVSTGPEPRRTRAEVPSGLVKQAAKRSNWQPPACSRPRGLGRKVSVEAASSPRAVEASSSGDALRVSVT